MYVHLGFQQEGPPSGSKVLPGIVAARQICLPGLPKVSPVSSEDTSNRIVIVKVKWDDLAGPLEWGPVGNLSVSQVSVPLPWGMAT